MKHMRVQPTMNYLMDTDNEGRVPYGGVLYLDESMEVVNAEAYVTIRYNPEFPEELWLILGASFYNPEEHVGSFKSSREISHCISFDTGLLVGSKIRHDDEIIHEEIYDEYEYCPNTDDVDQMIDIVMDEARKVVSDSAADLIEQRIRERLA